MMSNVMFIQFGEKNEIKNQVWSSAAGKTQSCKSQKGPNLLLIIYVAFWLLLASAVLKSSKFLGKLEYAQKSVPVAQKSWFWGFFESQQTFTILTLFSFSFKSQHNESQHPNLRLPLNLEIKIMKVHRRHTMPPPGEWRKSREGANLGGSKFAIIGQGPTATFGFIVAKVTRGNSRGPTTRGRDHLPGGMYLELAEFIGNLQVKL